MKSRRRLRLILMLAVLGLGVGISLVRKTNGQAGSHGPTAAARAVLRQVSERYRTQPAYFESISTEIRKTGQSETRRVTREKTYYFPPDKMRTQIDDEREPFVTLEDGQKRWTIYTAANEYRVQPQGKNLLRPMNIDPIQGMPHITGHEVFDGVACTVMWGIP